MDIKILDNMNNEYLFEYLLSKNNYQEYINQWINGDYKNKILIINGKKGNFKIFNYLNIY